MRVKFRVHKPGGEETADPRVHPRRPRDGRPEARRAAIVGVAESDLGQVAEGMSPSWT